MSDAVRQRAGPAAQAFVQPVVQAHRPPGRRRRGVGVGLSVAAHIGIALAVLWTAPKPQKVYDPQPVVVQMIDERPAPAPVMLRGPAPLPPAPAPPAPPKPTHTKAAAHKAPPRPAAMPRHLVSAPAAQAAASDSGVEMSDAELAGAATVGSGGGGGGSGGACDMAGRVQAALRNDPLARNAVARFAGKAVKVWDGDWVWIPGDDGRGVAAVRQAMMWEIAFAPAACRAQRVHGLVVLSAHSARLAVGSGEWRWSDLLTPHPGMGGAHYTRQ